MSKMVIAYNYCRFRSICYLTARKRISQISFMYMKSICTLTSGELNKKSERMQVKVYRKYARVKNHHTMYKVSVGYHAGCLWRHCRWIQLFVGSSLEMLQYYYMPILYCNVTIFLFICIAIKVMHYFCQFCFYIVLMH